MMWQMGAKNDRTATLGRKGGEEGKRERGKEGREEVEHAGFRHCSYMVIDGEMK